MNARQDARIVGSFAHYFGISQHDGLGRLHLRRDLGLEPLDLVLFVLELEQVDGPPFEFEALDRVGSVDDFVRLVGRWLARHDEGEPEDVDWVA